MNRWVTFLSATFLTLPGCLGGTEEGVANPGANANVKGKVTWKGEPIAAGMIEFVDQASGVSSSYAITDGSYSSEGMALTLTSGEKKVKIIGGDFKKDQKGQGTGVVHSGGVVVEQLDNVVPPEYNESTTLTANIQAGDNEVDFQLPK